MARKDLVGLAALGALGLMMGGRKSPEEADATPVEDRGTAVLRSAAPAEQADLGALYAEDATPSRLRRNLETGELYSPNEAVTRPVARRVSAPVARPLAMTGSGSGGGRGPAAGEVEEYRRAQAAMPRARMTPEQTMRALDLATGVRPMDPNAPRGPNAADSTELGRNLSNAMSAMTPGLSRAGRAAVGVAREFGPSSAAQRAYNQAAAARRAAEGYSPAEAQAAREAAELALRENKTLNPNAWLAGPRGMAENFKKGGKVVKKAASKPKRSSASSRADGIAQRGKTRGVMR